MRNRGVWKFFLTVAILGVIAVIVFQYTHQTTPAPTQLPAGDTVGTVTGRVTSSVLCQNTGGLGSTEHCDSLSYSAQVAAISKSTNEIVASTQTDGQGRYMLRMQPGTYIIRTQGNKPVPQCPDQILHIETGDQASLDIACDETQ